MNPVETHQVGKDQSCVILDLEYNVGKNRNLAALFFQNGILVFGGHL